MKSGSLNLLEPSGPLKAYNGTALPLPLPFLLFSISNDCQKGKECKEIHESVKKSF
jgi:hypothetical protein